MLDTVKLRVLGKEKFEIVRPSVFTPEFKLRSFSQLSFNERTKSDGKVRYTGHFIAHPPALGWYLPKVEIFEVPNLDRQTVDHTLLVEFSIPKLVFDNNLQEIVPADAQSVFLTLQSRLRDVGVRVPLDVIMRADVSWAHFGKNILLPLEMHLREILEELSKVEAGKVFEISKVRFTNGDALQLYCGVRELAFYDKVRDILKPRNKSVDKQKTEREKSIISEYDLEGREIFRYEYRLKNGQTIRSEINSALKRVYTTPVAFKDLFSEGLWKEMVVGSWQRLIGRPANQLLLVKTASPLALLTYVLDRATAEEKSGHSQNRALTSFGIAMVLKNCGGRVGLDEVRHAWSDEHPERLDAKIREAVSLVEGLPYPDYIAFINAELERFEPLTLDRLVREVGRTTI